MIDNDHTAVTEAADLQVQEPVVVAFDELADLSTLTFPNICGRRRCLRQSGPAPGPGCPPRCR